MPTLSDFGRNYLYKLFGILLQRKLSCSPVIYLLSTYLYKYDLVDVYFILYITIQCYVIYFAPEIVPGLATGH